MFMNWILAAVIVIVIAFALFREFVFFGLGLAIANRLSFVENHGAAVRILERMLQRKSLFGNSIHRTIRFRLSHQLQLNRQYDECIKQCEICLEGLRNPAAIAIMQLRLAEAMESIGRTAEADEARGKVSNYLEQHNNDLPTHMLYAQNLMRELKFSEAIAELEKALLLLPKDDQRQRPGLLSQMSNCAYQVGRMPEAANWGEQAVEAGGMPAIRVKALVSAGLSNASLGRLEKSEGFYKQAIDLQTTLGNREGAGVTKAILAGISRQRGKLIEALQLCEEAISESSSAKRPSRLQQYECLMALGRWNEARQMLDAGAKSNPLSAPSNERRMQGMFGMGRAVILVHQSQPVEALAMLNESLNPNASDIKLNRIVNCYKAWAAAQLGDREMVEQLTADLEVYSNHHL